MRRAFLCALSYLLTFGIAEAAPFAHFLEPGFPFAEIVVDARHLGHGFPSDNLTPRGVVVRLAEDTYIAYDTDLLRVAVAWKGGFLSEESLATMSYHHAKKKKGGGQAVLPAVIGDAIVASGLYPGVQIGDSAVLRDPRPPGEDPREIGRGAMPPGMGRWLGAEVMGERVLLNYEIGGIPISESPFVTAGGVIGRSLRIGRHPDHKITLLLGRGPSRVYTVMDGARPARLDAPPDQPHTLTLDTAERDHSLVILYGELEPGDLRPPPLRDPSIAHWREVITTRGELGSAATDYVVDRIPLPEDNPQRRNVRPSGIDFFPDGRAAVVTYDGDVWIVSGLDAGLGEVRWKRFAGGMHEPNSVRIRDGKDIFVCGRNGITELIDRDDDGEADIYRNHCSDFWQSAETRDFNHSMAIARDGSFFITKGGQQNDLPSKHSGRALHISPDGKRVQVFASGLRNAYLGIRPGTDEIYASDQQGHWVPTTPLHRIVEGGYYGFKPAAPWGAPEPAITPPLCWIPHAVAGSGLGPVWADPERFGPLSDSLIFLDFRQPGLLRTYLDDHLGQAASVPMTAQFDFPLLKGAINPVDGQLYLVGFQIWGTSAEKIRGMARLRYTRRPSLLPVRVAAGKNAICLRFDQALDPSFARFNVRRWNYRRSSGYGSGHFRPDGKAGEEILRHGGVRFSPDRRSVLVATPELSPVQQLAVSFELKTSSGEHFANSAYLTLHETHPLELGQEGFPGLDLEALAAEAAVEPSGGQEPAASPSAERGAHVYQAIGCSACHSVDGSTNGKSGPTWKGLAGSQRRLLDGGSAEATTEYLRESILDPTAKVTRGYNPKDVGMPSYRGILSESDVESVILFIESLTGEG